MAAVMSTGLVRTIVAAPAQENAVREGKPITLTGILERTWGFGRPDFGEAPETDEIEPYVRLRLKNPIRVVSFENYATAGIDRAQLIFAKRDSDEWRLANGAIETGPVTVKGILRLAVGGHHHEAIVLEVESLTIVKK